MSFQPKVPITDDELYDLYVAHGRQASPLAERLGCSASAARRRIYKLLLRRGEHPIAERSDPTFVNRVADLLQRSNVPPEAIARIKDARFKSWGVAAKVKNADGSERLETEGLFATDFSVVPVLNREDNPCLTQAPPISVTFTPNAAPFVMRGLYAITIMSDAQIGWLNGRNGFEPIHDPAAIRCAQKIIAAYAPRKNVWVGDVGDATQFSRWPQRREFAGCAQRSLDTTSRIIAETHAAAGPQCVADVIVGGNHDTRYQLYADTNAREYSGLKRANALPEEWPVNSFPFLVRLDEIGVTYAGEFPGNPYWLLDDLVVMHRPPKKLEMAATVLHGHTHHLTMTTHAQHHRAGRTNYFLYDVGCLCQVGSRLDPQSLVITCVPSDRERTDWAQGMAVVEVLEGKITKHQVTLIRIEDGLAIHRGEVFDGNDAVS